MFIARGTGCLTERFEIPSGQSYKALPTDTQHTLRRTVCELVGVDPKSFPKKTA